MRATMKNSSWACAAWPQAFTMIPANWLPACRFPRLRTGCRRNGSRISSIPSKKFRQCWAMTARKRMNWLIQASPLDNHLLQQASALACKRQIKKANCSSPFLFLDDDIQLCCATVCDMAAGFVFSSHLRILPASAIRDSLPFESRNTITTGRPSILACITRQRPASEIYPVFCKPISHCGCITRQRPATKKKPIFCRPGARGGGGAGGGGGGGGGGGPPGAAAGGGAGE